MNLIKNTFLIVSAMVVLAACKGGEESIGTSASSNNQTNKQAETPQDKPSEPAVGLNLGNKAPEIALKNLNDSVISLSSMIKGRLVLIDFWASWCGPCRHENPVVVSVYNEFKDKKFKNGNGFTIYSVSLDFDKNKWKQAIEKDGLVWRYHVSDLKMWNSEVVPKYNIQGIPTNILINEKGLIIGRDLRGDALKETLEKNLVK